MVAYSTDLLLMATITRNSIDGKRTLGIDVWDLENGIRLKTLFQLPDEGNRSLRPLRLLVHFLPDARLLAMVVACRKS